MYLTHDIVQNIVAITEKSIFAMAQPISKITAHNKLSDLCFEGQIT